MRMKYFLGLFLLCMTAAACSAEESRDKLVQSDMAVNPVTIADELEYPWGLAFLPDGEFLVTEKPGAMVRIGADGSRTDIQDVPAVFDKGQGGLLDVITAPGFTAEGGTIFFSYAAADTDDPAIAGTEVARAYLNLKNNSLEKIKVIFVAQPKVRGGNHWGSRLALSDDGFLYLTLGDRFNYRDEAQNLANHLGSVVRIYPDGEIPKNNPFYGQPGRRGEIFTYGHRNIQGIAIHPETHDIWIHEHGPKGGDEINRLVAGENYGWPKVSYGVNYSGTTISDVGHRAPFAAPVLHWTPSIAPSGMVFYTGEDFPAWRGDIFAGALAGQHLRRIKLDDARNVIEQEILLENLGARIRDVDQGPDGRLYILTDGFDGKLVRIDPAP